MSDRISSIKFPEGPEKSERERAGTPSAKISGADKRMIWAFFAMVLAIISLQFTQEPVKSSPELNHKKAAEILAGILNRAAAESNAEWQAFSQKALQITEKAERNLPFRHLRQRAGLRLTAPAWIWSIVSRMTMSGAAAKLMGF